MTGHRSRSPGDAGDSSACCSLSVGAAAGKGSSGRFCVTQASGHSSQEINISKNCPFRVQFPDQVVIHSQQGCGTLNRMVQQLHPSVEQGDRSHGRPCQDHSPHSSPSWALAARRQTHRSQRAPTVADSSHPASLQHTRHPSHTASQESAAKTIILWLCESLFN